MIDLTTINCWQRRDPDLHIPEPWYTFPALDEIKSWDLKDKTVLEIGGGASTIWWNARCKEVMTIEESAEWREHIFETWLHYYPSEYNTCFIYDSYALSKFDFKVDIAIVDNGGERDEMILLALQHLKPNGILIVDNWMQPSVDWIPSLEIHDLLTSFKHKIYAQEGHPDWKTLICWL